MLFWINLWSSTPQYTKLYSHLPPLSQTKQVRRLSEEHLLESRDKLMSPTLGHDSELQRFIYIISLRSFSAVGETCKVRFLIGTDEEREREREREKERESGKEGNQSSKYDIYIYTHVYAYIYAYIYIYMYIYKYIYSHWVQILDEANSVNALRNDINHIILPPANSGADWAL